MELLPLLQSNVKTQLLLLPSVAKSSSVLLPMFSSFISVETLQNWPLYFGQTFENVSDYLIELEILF